MLKLRVTPSMRAGLAEQARVENRSVSETVRLLIGEALLVRSGGHVPAVPAAGAVPVAKMKPKHNGHDFAGGVTLCKRCGAGYFNRDTVECG